MNKFFVITTTLVLLGTGCISHPPTLQPLAQPVAQQITTSTTITFYGSDELSAKYCNGAAMDSTSYKTTIGKKMMAQVPGQLSVEDKIKTTLSMAVSASEFKDSPYTRIASTTFANGVVTLHPAGGWAGSSIFMCAWVPFVESQLEQFPEVKQIKWEAVD